MSNAVDNEDAAEVPLIARNDTDQSQGVKSCPDGVSDVIAVLMDVTEPLEKLRKLLESQLHCSLEQFEFWLQDTMKVVGHPVSTAISKLILFCRTYGFDSP